MTAFHYEREQNMKVNYYRTDAARAACDWQQVATGFLTLDITNFQNSFVK